MQKERGKRNVEIEKRGGELIPNQRKAVSACAS